MQIYDKKEFIQACAHRHLVPIDNLTTITDSISDSMCKMSTGGGQSKRKLYTDDDDVPYNFLKVQVLNGVNLPVTKPDLLDRCLLFELERIAPENRQPESVIMADFERRKPVLLGACFDTLSKAMSYYEEAREKVTKLPRMADYALWGCAIAKALDCSFDDFLNAYEANRSRQNDEAIEASPLGSAILDLMQREPYVTGSPTAVMQKIVAAWKNNPALDDRDAPKSIQSFSRQLNCIRPNLEAMGFEIIRTKSGERKLTINSPRYVRAVQVTKASSKKDLSEDTLRDANAPSNAHKTFNFDAGLDVRDVLDASDASSSYCLEDSDPWPLEGEGEQ